MLAVGVYVMPQVIGVSFNLGEYPWHTGAGYWLQQRSSTGFGVLTASLARTPEQTSTLAATGAHINGRYFGGLMLPVVVMPLVMKKLAVISPMYWAHQACLDVILRDVSFSFILPKIIILTLFALVCFYVAGRKVKWM